MAAYNRPSLAVTATARGTHNPGDLGEQHQPPKLRKEKKKDDGPVVPKHELPKKEGNAVLIGRSFVRICLSKKKVLIKTRWPTHTLTFRKTRVAVANRFPFYLDV